MIAFDRTDNSTISRWVWTIDRWTLIIVTLLIVIGVVLTLAAAPATAQRKGLEYFFFVKRQMIYIGPALFVLLATSLLSVRAVRRVGLIGLVLTLGLTALATFAGVEVNGSSRWLRIAFLSIQPSEFLKPFFIITVAWLLSESRRDPSVPGPALSAGICAVIVGMLAMQPDIGMATVILLVWGTMYFVTGMPMLLVAGLVGLTGMAGTAAYSMFDHVRKRVDTFLDPSAENYQVDRALDAFQAGGWVGTGPGAGQVKHSVPDGHTDFIFAVTAEEFGAILCIAIIALFGILVVRGMIRIRREQDLFVVLGTVGILTLFGIQSLINIGVNLKLLPAKGMTLPFISYGGSSLISLSLCAGFLLALTRSNSHSRGMS